MCKSAGLSLSALAAVHCRRPASSIRQMEACQPRLASGTLPPHSQPPSCPHAAIPPNRAPGCRSLYPGDSRAALVPFLAHKQFGDTYKWLLYMDDDTIFFPDAVIRLLEEFDPDMPYFISG